MPRRFRRLGLTMVAIVGLSSCGEEPQGPSWTTGPSLAVGPVLPGYTVEVFCDPGYPPYIVGGPIATTVTNVGGAPAFHIPTAALDPAPGDSDVITCPDPPVHGVTSTATEPLPMPLPPGEMATVGAYPGHTGLYRLRLTYGRSFDRANTDTVYSSWFRISAVIRVVEQPSDPGTTTETRVVP